MSEWIKGQSPRPLCRIIAEPESYERVSIFVEGQSEYDPGQNT